MNHMLVKLLSNNLLVLSIFNAIQQWHGLTPKKALALRLHAIDFPEIIVILYPGKFILTAS